MMPKQQHQLHWNVPSDSIIGERVAFKRAIGEGAIVQERGKDQSAIAEMEAFFKEIQL